MLLWEHATAVAGAHHRHQPLRPAGRRERQVSRPRPARRRRRPARAALHRRRGHGLRLPGLALRRRRHVARRRRGPARAARPGRTATSPSRPTSTATATRALADVRADDRRRAPTARSPSGGGRGSCTRPGSTTRAARDRRLPPGHRPARARPRRARTGRSRSTSSSSPRPWATGRCSPRRAARCSACTSTARPTWTPYARRCSEPRAVDGRDLDQPAARPRGPTAPADRRARAGWCCSASPATCRARR